MKLRHYLLLQGYLTAAIALFIAGLPIFLKVDTFGLCFAIGFSAFCAVRAYSCFKDVRLVRDEERAFAPSVNASVSEQIAHCKRILIICGIVFPALAIITAIDLNSLENGNRESVMLVFPIAFLYHVGGFLPAVSAIPLFGITICGALYWKLHKLNDQNDRKA